MNNLNEQPEWKLGWLAGMLDGEGCIGLYHTYHNKYYAPRVQVVNTHEPTIVAFALATGMDQVSKRQPKGNRKVLYHWEIRSVDEVYSLLSKVLPYMLTRRKQAELLFEYCGYELLYGKCSAERYYIELAKLNKRGVK